MKDQNRVHVWPQDPLPGGATVWPRMLGQLTGHGESRYESLPDYYCPHLILHGQGTVEVEGRQHRLASGDMFTLWPGVHITYYEDPDAPWEFYWLHLIGGGALDWMTTCGFQAERPVLRPREPDAARDLIAAIYEVYAGRRPLTACRVVGLLYELAAAVTVKGPKAAEPVSKTEQLVQQAVTIVDRMLDTSVNVDELADILGVDRTTLFRAFRKRLGKTPIQYLTRMRIKKARELLAETEMDIDAVARAAGYQNVKYFFRRFRETTGMTPAQFRRQHS